MSVSINGTGGITFADASTQSTGGYTGFRNRIINGAMMIDQRNAGASVTRTNGSYTLDRWAYFQSQASKFTAQQNAGSVTPPVGFTKYLGFTSSSAYSVVSGDYFAFQQSIEGFNVADLGWGTANAKTVTLSFWARSSLTGQFGGSLKNLATSANRSYAFSYTISSANTWEYKTITIAGDTSGSWATDNSCGLCVCFDLGTETTYLGAAGSWAGSNYLGATGDTKVVATNGATFYITGVQLEKGSTATPFEFRPYGTELALCQRYYEVMSEPFGAGRVNGSPAPRFFARFTVQKRATPTCTGVGSFSCSDMYTVDTQQSAAQGASIINHITTSGLVFGFNSSTLSSPSAFTSGAMAFNLYNNGAVVTASSEL